MPCTLSIRRPRADNNAVMRAKLPETEAVRLQILRDYDILDTPLEAEFDDFTLLASQICGTSIALISLIDEERQWFKSRLGIDASETCRDAAFCAHALHHTEVFLVPDAQKDPRFCDNPLVTGEPFVRFYAGAPLLTAGGHALGTLCVIDQEPRTLTRAQQSALQALARQVMARLELRRGIAARARAERKLREGEALKAAILNSALDSIITINASGCVVEWNPAAEATFGYRTAEVIGRNLSALIIPEAHREAHQRGMARYLATGEGPVLGQRIEITALRADGAEFPVELAIVPIRLASGPLFTATLRDITVRKEVELALRQAHDEMESRVEARTRDLDGLRRHTASLLLAMGEGILGLDTQGRATFINPAAARLIGWEPSELIGRCVYAVLHPSGPDGSGDPLEDCWLAQTVRTGQPCQGDDEVLLRRDGTAMPVEYSATLLYEDGRVTGAVITFQDITARRASEAALCRSEVRYQRIAANVPGMVFQSLTHPDGTIEFPYISEGIRRIFDLSPAEACADPHLILNSVHSEDRAAFLSSLAEKLQDGTYWHWKGRIISRSGEEKWVEGTSHSERQANGDLLGEGLLSDVTARQQAQAALAEANQALARESAERQNIMETVPDILFRLDLSGRLIGWNRRMETVTELTPEQLQDRDPLLLFAPAERDAIHTAILQAFAAGYAEVEADLLVAGGGSAAYQFSGSPMRDSEGQVIGITGIGRDITARKLAEARIHSLNEELSRAYNATIEGWSRALDLRDHETEGHSRRVTEMTLRLAAALGVSELEMAHIRRGALLHDIGKMAVPDGVLLKPGPLNDEEWAVMRQHPVWAYEMLLPIEFLRPALNIPYCHHEKWDGSGYPRGLAGEEIPLAARMFALVDVWDALSSDRPYRRAWEAERVLDHLSSLSGSHFEPRLVKAFLSLMDPVEMNTLSASTLSGSMPVRAQVA